MPASCYMEAKSLSPPWLVHSEHNDEKAKITDRLLFLREQRVSRSLAQTLLTVLLVPLRQRGPHVSALAYARLYIPSDNHQPLQKY